MKIEDEYRTYIEQHMVESKMSALEINNAIIDSELNAGGNNYTHTLHIPKFFTQEDKKIFQEIVSVTYAIFEKVIQAYRKDEKVRALFPFSQTLEDLILCQPRYKEAIPICRIDIFYNEETKDFHFCEFNTDGTAAMNENERLNQIFSMHNILQKDKRHYEFMELVQAWAKAFLSIAKEDPKVPDKPMIAIVDFLNHAYLNELYVFQEVFKAYGCTCEVLDIHDLVYENHRLLSKHTKRPIDMIYRRAVTSDIMEDYANCQAFIQAVQEDTVCLVGAFQTQIVHHKEIMKVLFHPYLQKYFTEAQKTFIAKHCPATYELDDSLPIDLKDKDQWIIKPKDSYGAKGVWAGVDLDQKQWEKVVADFKNKDYIVQSYISPYKTWNIDLARSDHFQRFTNMTGLYTFNGQFAGVYSRLSDSGIISSQYNERTIPTLFVV